MLYCDINYQVATLKMPISKYPETVYLSGNFPLKHSLSSSLNFYLFTVITGYFCVYYTLVKFRIVYEHAKLNHPLEFKIKRVK